MWHKTPPHPQSDASPVSSHAVTADAAQVSRLPRRPLLPTPRFCSRRYFEDLADNVRPGVISQALREAIGLDDDKLPIWIYRMRVLGYPPGWMRVADMSGTVVPLLEEAEQTDTHSDRDSE